MNTSVYSEHYFSNSDIPYCDGQPTAGLFLLHVQFAGQKTNVNFVIYPSKPCQAFVHSSIYIDVSHDNSSWKLMRISLINLTWLCCTDQSLGSWTQSNPFTPKFTKYNLPTVVKRRCVSQVGRIGSIIMFHLSKRWKVKFSILCDVISWWGCSGNLKLIALGSGRVKGVS